MVAAAQPTLAELLERDAADAWRYFDRLSNLYTRELHRLAKDAVPALHRAQFTRKLTAAGEPADWILPDPDQLINTVKASGDLFAKTRTLREQIAETAIGGTLAAYGLSFNLRNPTIENVLTQMGQHITRVVEAQRAEIMASLQDSWQQGLSIRDAARKMIRDSTITTRARADMIARTELTGATSGGSLAAARLVNDASPEDTRLVKIWIATNDDRTRDSHAQASDDYGTGNGIPINQPFIVGGAAMDHPGDPSGPPEEVINCFPEDTLVELPGIRAVMRHWYDGYLVRISFAGGDSLTGSPNHPILTPDGDWQPLCKFNEGDYCVRGSIVRHSSGAPHIDARPAEIGEVYRAAQRAGYTERIAAAPPDLHGDVTDSEIEVVAVDRYLGFHLHAATDEQVREFGFALAYEARTAFSRGERGSMPARGSWRGERDLTAPASGVSRRRPLAQYLDPCPIGGHQVGLAATTDRLPGLLEPPLHDRAADAETAGQRDDALTIHVATDEIVDVEFLPFHGYLLNVDTGEGYYIANGVVAGNCRCSIGYEQGTGGVALPPPPEPIAEPIPVEAPVPPEVARLANGLVSDAARVEPRVTSDLSRIVGSNGGRMGGLEFRLKTEKSLAGKLERKATEKGITPEAYSKSVADVLRYTGVYEAPDYAAGVERTLADLKRAGYKFDNSDIENYWQTGDDYNGINMTTRTPSGYRFELQFHTPESLDLKNGELHTLYEQFRDETNPHQRLNLWDRMVELSNQLPQPSEDVLKIGTRTVHKAPELPSTPEQLAKSLVDLAERHADPVQSDLQSLVAQHNGSLGGLEFRLKAEDSVVRKLTLKGELDPVAYSRKIADVLRFTGVFDPADYAQGARDVISGLRARGYHILDSDIENYWQVGDDYNGINLNLSTPDGYRFELQFHTPESFALKNGDLHRIYEEFRASTDQFIRRQLWDQMVNLSDNLQTRMDLGVIMDIRKVGTLAAHEPPIAATIEEIDSVTHFDKYLARDAADALDRYTGISYDDINAYLRTGDLKINRHTGSYEYLGTQPAETNPTALADRIAVVKRWIDNMKDTFLPAEKPFIAYRGFRKAVLTDKYGATADLKNLIGKTIEDKGFVSVSANQRIAEGFGTSDENVVMELAVPKDMPTLNAYRSGTGNTFEQEILLPPGTRFVIQSIRQPRRPGPYIIRAIVEPPNA